MLSTEVLAQLEIAVNVALKLPHEHGFGWHFVSHYIDDPAAYKADPEWMGVYSPPSTDYESMSKWAWELGSMSAGRDEPPEQIHLTKDQHQILVDFLIENGGT